MIEEQPAPQERQLCVLVDTNNWRKSMMLRSGTGAALLHYLHRSGGKLGLSEVVEKETRAHILEDTLVAIKHIEDGFRTIGAIAGGHSRYEVPTEQVIADGIENRFRDLHPLIVCVPISIEHVWRALDRVNAKFPPNVNKEQFKDSLIWAAALELGRTYRVHFVSADKQFYHGQDYKDGLARQLAVQCQDLRIELYIYNDLAQVLGVLAEQAPGLDKNGVAQAISATIESEVQQALTSTRLALGQLIHHEISAYSTEQTDVLGVEFELKYQGLENESYADLEWPRSDRDLADALVAVKGDCLYSMLESRVFDGRLNRIEFLWRNESGEETLEPGAIVFLSSTSTGRQVPYRVRRQLDR